MPKPLTTPSDEHKISRMISTVDANNGFRHELIPIAVNGSSFAAKGLRMAILALSAYHRHGLGAALPYKIQALRLLSHSLDKESFADVPIESQLAASMMLCVYNVSVHSSFPQTISIRHRPGLTSAGFRRGRGQMASPPERLKKLTAPLCRHERRRTRLRLSQHLVPIP